MTPGFNPRGVRYIRRIRTGDSGEGGFGLGFDGDIDLRDFSVSQRCLTGPGDFDRLCDCRFLDIDHDRDVDLDDLTLFTTAMTGPG